MRGEMTLPISDFELAQASAAGDEAAFEQIYRTHHRRVYSLCLRMLGNPTDAEDVTQDVFVQLFRKIGSFQGDAALSTWLYRLTVNTVLMHIRHRQRRHKEQATEDESLQSLAEMNQSKERDEASQIDRIALERAIQQLPNGYRHVLVLHDIQGYEHDEIGRMLGISSGTSKSQLHKARLKLRQLLLAKRPKKQPIASGLKIA
jgi:RNA polymerase sigma-70 factor (ECF subfamily)